MPLIVDNAGNYVMPGRTRRTLIEENFYQTATINQLLTATGTATLNSVGAGRGAYRVMTPASAGGVASLTIPTGNGVWSEKMEAIYLELNGLSFTTSNLTIEVGIEQIDAATQQQRGAKLMQGPSDPTASVVMGGAATAIPNNQLAGNLGGNVRNLGLLLVPSQRELHVMESGEIAFTFRGTAYNHFRLTPFLRVTAPAATPVGFDLAQFRFTIFQN